MKPAILVALVALFLMGCAPEAPQKSGDGIALQGLGTTTIVQEVELKDGTRCAVAWGVNKAGIDCDWRAP